MYLFKIFKGTKRLFGGKLIIYDKTDAKTVKSVREIIKSRGAKIYLIGIGGVSMSAIAKMLLSRGISVGGSDISGSDVTDELRSLGARVFLGHSEENIRNFGADACAYSLSVGEDNPEYRYAKGAGIPTLSRASLIKVLCEGYAARIGVGGTHGKSTVSAMLYSALLGAGGSADLLFGADYFGRGAFVRGGGELAVLEACEYGNSFLELGCDIAVLLNVELDHTDFFSCIDDILGSFFKFASSATRLAVLCYDDERLMRIKERLTVRCITFGKGEGADVRYIKRQGTPRAYSFYINNEWFCDLTLSVMGEHNASNIAAVIAVLFGIGRLNTGALSALERFSGIGRRIECIGHIGRTGIFYDYAHHPTEIRATLSALRSEGFGKIGVVFRPHTYSRTRSLLSDFAEALAPADEIFITDIYAAREEKAQDIAAETLALAIRKISGNAKYLPADRYCEIEPARYGALVLMGAGDLWEIRQMLCNRDDFLNE
ncbi:MAG: UDP-N-acetylmuramate--L-alanine ligase [Clostridia bacterium]|nr:UDP-N-acetylmuramate--L-alanine ligase [Clostridia bacterium]